MALMDENFMVPQMGVPLKPSFKDRNFDDKPSIWETAIIENFRLFFRRICKLRQDGLSTFHMHEWSAHAPVDMEASVAAGIILVVLSLCLRMFEFGFSRN